MTGHHSERSPLRRVIISKKCHHSEKPLLRKRTIIPKGQHSEKESSFRRVNTPKKSQHSEKRPRHILGCFKTCLNHSFRFLKHVRTCNMYLRQLSGGSKVWNVCVFYAERYGVSYGDGTDVHMNEISIGQMCSSCDYFHALPIHKITLSFPAPVILWLCMMVFNILNSRKYEYVEVQKSPAATN